MGNLLFFPPLTGPYIAQAVLELLRPPVLISKTLRLWAYNHLRWVICFQV